LHLKYLRLLENTPELRTIGKHTQSNYRSQS